MVSAKKGKLVGQWQLIASVRPPSSRENGVQPTLQLTTSQPKGTNRMELQLMGKILRGTAEVQWSYSPTFVPSDDHITDSLSGNFANGYFSATWTTDLAE